MLRQTETTNDVLLPFDDTHFNLADATILETDTNTFVIDGTGRLQVVNTGGTSAAEGGMGSGSDNSGKEKGDLEHPSTGEKGGKPNTDSDAGWDPIGENIDKETAKKESETGE